MDYSQNSVGNCCGAWCVTRYFCLIKKLNCDTSDIDFKKEGQKIWSDVQFKTGEGAPPDWVKNKYSDPWKMVDKLGGTSTVQIEPAAELTKIPEHKGLLSILKSLTSSKKRIPGNMTICGLPKGGYAIAVMHDGHGLHYMLVHRPGADTDFELYDPRDEYLNWTTHKTFSYLNPVKTKTKAGNQNYTFLGVFIEIK